MMANRQKSLSKLPAGNGLGWILRFLPWLAIIFVWLVVLPLVFHFEAISEYVARMKRAGIDPSAIYYTEHPASRDWERSMQDKVARDRKSFWSFDRMK